ncbi:hypothetical protein BLNAU_9756 [Blattamonas nauphoetae]|uniref:Uncharacterized protein n=1 Tax=Blattamonas nauphoetae TaxID=2049346 RepID=A0ABQ9XV59_9EUKA|nr:hypothetical protein BLNAU_9756 [Blattamonas nauphoetae]
MTIPGISMLDMDHKSDHNIVETELLNFSQSSDVVTIDPFQPSRFPADPEIRIKSLSHEANESESEMTKSGEQSTLSHVQSSDNPKIRTFTIPGTILQEILETLFGSTLPIVLVDSMVFLLSSWQMEHPSKPHSAPQHPSYITDLLSTLLFLSKGFSKSVKYFVEDSHVLDLLRLLLRLFPISTDRPPSSSTPPTTSPSKLIAELVEPLCPRRCFRMCTCLQNNPPNVVASANLKTGTGTRWIAAVSVAWSSLSFSLAESGVVVGRTGSAVSVHFSIDCVVLQLLTRSHLPQHAITGLPRSAFTQSSSPRLTLAYGLSAILVGTADSAEQFHFVDRTRLVASCFVISFGISGRESCGGRTSSDFRFGSVPVLVGVGWRQEIESVQPSAQPLDWL